MTWIRALTGVVAERQNLAPGDLLDVQEWTARLLERQGQAVRIPPPGSDVPVAVARGRTR